MLAGECVRSLDVESELVVSAGTVINSNSTRRKRKKDKLKLKGPPQQES